MEEKGVVLVIEDDPRIQSALQEKFGFIFKDGNYRLVSALSLIDGEREFLTHQEKIVAIGIDGYVPLREGGRVEPSIFLAREIRQKHGFAGPMVAMSGDADLQRLLVEAGCSSRCDQKSRVLEEITSLLSASAC